MRYQLVTDDAKLGTIAQLAARKQRYKLSMFRRLHRILLMTVVIIAIFFIVSSLSFSNRLAEGTITNYAPLIIPSLTIGHRLCCKYMED